MSDYQQVARDCNMTATQKLMFMHNKFRGDSKCLYINSVSPAVQGFEHAVELFGNEYNSIVRQSRVKNILNTRRLQSQLGEDGDEGEALKKIYNTITNLSPQVPMSHVVMLILLNS